FGDDRGVCPTPDTCPFPSWKQDGSVSAGGEVSGAGPESLPTPSPKVSAVGSKCSLLVRDSSRHSPRPKLSSPLSAASADSESGYLRGFDRCNSRTVTLPPWPRM